MKKEKAAAAQATSKRQFHLTNRPNQGSVKDLKIIGETPAMSSQKGSNQMKITTFSVEQKSKNSSSQAGTSSIKQLTKQFSQVHSSLNPTNREDLKLTRNQSQQCDQQTSPDPGRQSNSTLLRKQTNPQELSSPLPDKHNYPSVKQFINLDLPYNSPFPGDRRYSKKDLEQPGQSGDPYKVLSSQDSRRESIPNTTQQMSNTNRHLNSKYPQTLDHTFDQTERLKSNQDGQSYFEKDLLQQLEIQDDETHPSNILGAEESIKDNSDFETIKDKSLTAKQIVLNPPTLQETPAELRNSIPHQPEVNPSLSIDERSQSVSKMSNRFQQDSLIVDSAIAMAVPVNGADTELPGGRETFGQERPKGPGTSMKKVPVSSQLTMEGSSGLLPKQTSRDQTADSLLIEASTRQINDSLLMNPGRDSKASKDYSADKQVKDIFSSIQQQTYQQSTKKSTGRPQGISEVKRAKAIQNYTVRKTTSIMNQQHNQRMKNTSDLDHATQPSQMSIFSDFQHSALKNQPGRSRNTKTKIVGGKTLGAEMGNHYGNSDIEVMYRSQQQAVAQLKQNSSVDNLRGDIMLPALVESTSESRRMELKINQAKSGSTSMDIFKRSATHANSSKFIPIKPRHAFAESNFHTDVRQGDGDDGVLQGSRTGAAQSVSSRHLFTKNSGWQRKGRSEKRSIKTTIKKKDLSPGFGAGGHQTVYGSSSRKKYEFLFKGKNLAETLGKTTTEKFLPDPLPLTQSRSKPALHILNQSITENTDQSIMSIEEEKPVLQMDEEDQHRILRGHMASQEFLKKNKKELSAFVSKILSSDEMTLMKGYQEFSHNNQMGDQKRQPEDPFGGGSIDGIMEQIDPAKAPSSKGVLPEDLKLLQSLTKQVKTNIESSRLENIGLTSKVMENWLNETLTDAENLDIPGIILRPEHKNPITRYGIDRIELTNSGIPNDFVDRIYRCLFVYSVGFYEMIKKMISHSNEKYSLITRIWKVFTVILEYCCVTDYKMMITKVNQAHENHVEELHRQFDEKCQVFIDNEKVLKQNIATLQKKNEDLERDKTNERNLRLRLEEEYVQNTKNHEEEVQLRLQFESKLNFMHTQQRDTDIKYKRTYEEMTQAQNLVRKLDSQLADIKSKFRQAKDEIITHKEKITSLSEKLKVAEADVESKTFLIEQMQDRMRQNTEETTTTRFQMNNVQNESNKQGLKIEMLEAKVKQLEAKADNQRVIIQEQASFKVNLEEKQKELRSQCNEQVINLNEVKQQHVLDEENLKTKTKLTEFQSTQIEEQTKTIEDLQLQKENLLIEVDMLKTSLERITDEYEEASEKIHKINRYRHELELRYKAEKLTTERQESLIEEKSFTIKEKTTRIAEQLQQLDQQEKKIQELHSDIRDLKAELDATINKFQVQVDELTHLVKQERINKEEWATRFKVNESTLSSRTQKILSLEQQLQVILIDKDQLNLTIDKMNNTLKIEREEREEFEQQAQSNLHQFQQKEKELSDLVSIARQLEQQRYNQYRKADRDIAVLEHKIQQTADQNEFMMADYEAMLLREDLRYQNLEAALAKQQEEYELKLKHKEMEIQQIMASNLKVLNEEQMEKEDYFGQLRKKTMTCYTQSKELTSAKKTIGELQMNIMKLRLQGQTTSLKNDIEKEAEKAANLELEAKREEEIKARIAKAIEEEAQARTINSREAWTQVEGLDLIDHWTQVTQKSSFSVERHKQSVGVSSFQGKSSLQNQISHRPEKLLSEMKEDASRKNPSSNHLLQPESMRNEANRSLLKQVSSDKKLFERQDQFDSANFKKGRQARGSVYVARQSSNSRGSIRMGVGAGSQSPKSRSARKSNLSSSIKGRSSAQVHLQVPKNGNMEMNVMQSHCQSSIPESDDDAQHKMEKYDEVQELLSSKAAIMMSDQQESSAGKPIESSTDRKSKEEELNAELLTLHRNVSGELRKSQGGGDIPTVNDYHDVTEPQTNRMLPTQIGQLGQLDSATSRSENRSPFLNKMQQPSSNFDTSGKDPSFSQRNDQGILLEDSYKKQKTKKPLHPEMLIQEPKLSLEDLAALREHDRQMEATRQAQLNQKNQKIKSLLRGVHSRK